MSHRLLSVSVVLLIGGLAAASRIEAQTIPSPYEFIDERQEYGIFVGSVPGNRGVLELGPGGGLLVGARFGYHLSGPLGLEASAFLLPGDRRVRVPGDEGGFEDLGTADALVGGLDARVRFSIIGNRTWNGISPFLTAGGGVAMDLRQRSDLEAEIPSNVRFSFGPSFMGGLGAGVRWLPTDRLTVRGEATVNYWKLGTPPEIVQAGQPVIGQPVPEHEWAAVGAYTLGLSYRR